MTLNSWQFLVLATSAVLVLPRLSGWPRVATALAVNLIFAWSYWGMAAMAVALGYIAAGYVCARVVRTRGGAALVLGLVALTTAFLYLRGYRLDGWTGPGAAPTLLAFTGISFLFFKMVHVVVDAASGSIDRVTLGSYLNYCLNFTTVLMGPIQRYQDFVAQENAPEAASLEDHVDAVNRVLRGLLKSFVLAPFIAPYVLAPGRPIESMGGGTLLLATYGFYVFLYLDFSGYCDTMIGIARLMGLRLPENFDLPFLSRNVSEYWLRVHRSLTLWLTDYIFTPVYLWALHSRGLRARVFLALAGSLMLTMFVAGVWHGTTPNFAVFGLVHGLALVAVRGYEQLMVRKLGRARFREITGMPGVRAAATALTYNFTSLAYTFFVLDLGESMRVFRRLAVALAGAS